MNHKFNHMVVFPW